MLVLHIVLVAIKYYPTKKAVTAKLQPLFLSEWRDSNSRPPRPERGTLPTALHPENPQMPHVGEFGSTKVEYFSQTTNRARLRIKRKGLNYL